MELKEDIHRPPCRPRRFQSHLYGIESALVVVLGVVWIMFQSHLYGIESLAGEGQYATRHVSIAPLWNWKCGSPSQGRWHLWFQSHLYGIERSNILFHPEWKLRFNRTFMELKEYNCAFKFRPVFKFQSHLYGIERTKWNDWSPPARVSIAPLWNWKYMPCTIKFRAHMFQSHLYGIESFHFFASSIAPTVSIAPLWNWKWLVLPLLVAVLGFNRTFMELKVMLKS